MQAQVPDFWSENLKNSLFRTVNFKVTGPSLRILDDFCGLGSFRLSFRGLWGVGHLRLLEADE